MNAHDLSYRKRKLQWHARRGLLELDVILAPFIESQLMAMPAHEVAVLETLLMREDPHLWQMMLSPEAPQTRAELTADEHHMLGRILNHD